MQFIPDGLEEELGLEFGGDVVGGTHLTIYCTGPGGLSVPNGEPEPADGAAAPPNLVFQTTAKVTVLFSGLTATLAALYQVNVQVPDGVTPGSAVPVMITVTNPLTGAPTASNPVTVATQ